MDDKVRKVIISKNILSLALNISTKGALLTSSGRLFYSARVQNEKACPP